MPEGRPAEIWGSVAVAYGRLYFTTEEGLYCVGRKGAPFKATATRRGRARRGASGRGRQGGAAPDRAGRGDRQGGRAGGASRPGRSTTRAASCARRTRPGAVEGLAGAISPDGRSPRRRRPPPSGKVKATVGELSATTQVRFFGALPWSFDFEQGAVPRHWIGAGPRFKVADLGGGKRLHKPPQEAGLQRATVFIGPPSLSGYTIEADLHVHEAGPARGRRRASSTRATRSTSWARSRSCSCGPGPPSSRSRRRSRSPSEPDVWYRMKLRVDVAGRQGDRARARSGRRTAPEPADWTITLEDPLPVRAGSPGIYGDSATDLY